MWLLSFLVQAKFTQWCMICTGNEDGPTWTRRLGHLREACPILLEQGFEGGSVIYGEIDREMDEECDHPFVFMSDRDKGLKPALHEVFPRNLAVSCAKHIQANVKAHNGQQCAWYVIQLRRHCRRENQATYSIEFVLPNSEKVGNTN
jgi:hypothetical protein